MLNLTPPARNTIIAESSVAYYGGDPTRVELLRDVARALQAGQVVLAITREAGTLTLRCAWRDAPYQARRAATVAVLRAGLPTT